MLDRILGHQRIGPFLLPFLRRPVSVGVLLLLVGISSLRAVLFMVIAPGVSSDREVWAPLFEQIIGAWAVWAAVPVVLYVVLRMPHPARYLWRSVPTHLFGYLLFSIVQIGLMWAIHGWLDRPLGLPTSMRSLGFQIAWEMQQTLLVYGGVAALLTLLIAWEEQRQTALHAARMNERVTAQRLAQLTAQVHPHFLYNALNTISEQMFSDPHGAERLLRNIGQILRATLNCTGPVWTLREELTHTQAYAEVMVARFGDRISVQLGEIPSLNDELVPCFSIQTLVENAIRHNSDRSEPIRIEVSLKQQGDALVLLVTDNGQGFRGDPRAQPEAPGGLARMKEVLALLYGDSGQIVVQRSAAGGALVEVALPLSSRRVSTSSANTSTSFARPLP